MPVVPKYGEQVGGLPQVREAPLPNVRFTATAPVAAFGVPTGLDLTGVANVARQLWEQERAKQNQIVNLRAAGELREAATDIQVRALSRRGEDAFAASDDATKEYKEATDRIRKGLTNEFQLLVFEERANQHWGALHENLLKHTAAEGQRVDGEKTESFITNTRRYGLENYRNPELLAQSLQEIGMVRRDWGRRNGVPPEEIKRLEANDKSQFHVGIIARMHTNGEAAAAKAYFEAHKTELVDNDLLQTEQRVKTAFGDEQGATVAGEVWAALGPKRPCISNSRLFVDCAGVVARSALGS